MTKTQREKIKRLKQENKELSKNTRLTLSIEAIEKMEEWLEKTKDSKLLQDPKNYSLYLSVQEFYSRSKRAVLNGEKVSNGASIRPKDKELPSFEKERFVFPN